MLRKLPNLIPASVELETDAVDSSLRVLLAYENLAVGTYAMETFEMLLSRFGDELRFHISIWPFAHLWDEITKLDAIRDAVEADVISIAFQGDELLPELKHWLDIWMPQKRGQTAVLAALLQSRSGIAGSSPAYTYLQTAASSVGLNFLARQVPAGLPPASRLGASILVPRASLFAGYVDNPVPDNYGING